MNWKLQAISAAGAATDPPLLSGSIQRLAARATFQMGRVEGPLDSVVAFVERSRAKKVSVDLEVYTDMPHNFKVSEPYLRYGLRTDGVVDDRMPEHRSIVWYGRSGIGSLTGREPPSR